MNPADIFGKLRVVRWNGFDFTLSLIRWGFLRRYRARRGKITFFDTGALFIPKYEIAVYEGAPAVVYSEAPAMVFYYPDKAAALLRLGDLESAIVEGGLDGAPTLDFIRAANPQRQHNWVLRVGPESSAASRQAAAASNEYVRGIFAHAMEEAKKPRGAYRSALLGAETRCKLLIVIADVEAETGVPAVVVASDTGHLMEHPRLTLVLENDDLLRAVVPLCFPSVHNIRVQWPSVIAAHRDKPNTPDMLRQKAGELAMFILTTENDVLENAALWYRVIDEEAFVYIHEDRDLFADYLQDSLARYLALQNYAVDEICGTMAERSKEYAQYREWRGKEQPTRIVLSDGTESSMDLPADGTLLCEAFKHFNGSPERLNYNFGLQFVQAHVYELLTGKEMPARRKEATS